MFIKPCNHSSLNNSKNSNNLCFDTISDGAISPYLTPEKYIGFEEYEKQRKHNQVDFSRFNSLKSIKYLDKGYKNSLK